MKAYKIWITTSVKYLPSVQYEQNLRLTTGWGEILFFPKKWSGQIMWDDVSFTKPTGKQVSSAWNIVGQRTQIMKGPICVNKKLNHVLLADERKLK